MTTKRVELIKKKKFVVAIFNLKYEAFVVHVATLSVNLGDKIYLLKRAQIAYLKVDEAPTKVPGELLIL